MTEAEYEALKGETVEFETTDREGNTVGKILGLVTDVWFWHHSDPAFDISIPGSHGNTMTLKLIQNDNSWSYSIIG